ncbi:hypothetical protein [Haloarchaeobius iranensis]|nr:hypothetical protein [Haloarchaeobius iranensis]
MPPTHRYEMRGEMEYSTDPVPENQWLLGPEFERHVGPRRDLPR